MKTTPRSLSRRASQATATGGKQALLAAGRQDQMVPPSGTLKLAEMLKAAEAVVSLHWHAGGHELGQDDIAAAQRWIGAWKPSK
jgi:phospholipase/carboxylesterase